MDFVEVGVIVDFFVCKIMDWGKVKFECDKKVKEFKKKVMMIEIKEVKYCLMIDLYDMGIKIKCVECFFKVGKKVKVMIFFCYC